MPIGDVYQGTIHFELQGNPNSYSWYYNLTNAADEEAVNLDILTQTALWKDQLRPLHSEDVTFRCVEARQVHPNKSLPEITDLAGEAGTRVKGTNVTLPGQCSMIVTLYGNKADPTRFNRGRDFQTGWYAEDQDNGKWVFAVMLEMRAAYIAFGNTFLAGSGNQWDIGIWSNGRIAGPGGDPPAVAAQFFKLEFVKVKQLIRTQRRRQALDPCEVVTTSPIPVPP